MSRNHFDFWENHGQFPLEHVSGHEKEEKMIGRSLHGSTKGGCHLSSLTAFGDTMTAWMDEGWAANVIYCDFRRAFDTFSCYDLVYKLDCYSLDGGPPGLLGLEHWSCRVRMRDWGYHQPLVSTALPRGQEQSHHNGTWWEDERHKE